MTDQQNNIQRARDVLAKYRSYAGTAQDWVRRGGASQLIRLTTDPDLLDAMDDVFAEALDTEPGGRDMQAGWESGVRHTADLLATAILAADEQMSA